jgi:hypothetical protein
MLLIFAYFLSCHYNSADPHTILDLGYGGGGRRTDMVGVLGGGMLKVWIR